MKLVACSLLFLVACQDDESYYYTQPGGGGGGFGTTIASPDAGTTDGGGMTIQGQVCGLSEILRWDECDQTGMGDLTVYLDGAESMPAPNGVFQIPSPTSTDAMWRVAGGAHFASLRGYSGVHMIPSITNTLYQDTAVDANVALENNVGTIFVRVRKDMLPVLGATGVLDGSIELVYYDDPAGSAAFSVGETRAAGIVWFPNVAPGMATITITPPAAVGAPETRTVTVEADTATYVDIAFQNAQL